jgi:hypothetical protein
MSRELIALMDAIELLTAKRRELLAGPCLPYRIVADACTKLEQEASQYLTGK